MTRKAGRSPSAFYALLLMDGDSVGKLLHDHPESAVAAALKEFASGVAVPVTSAGGYLVYAGGDDLLALLPIEDALTAAITLRDAYGKAFASAGIPEATTSASLVFAHFRVPLRQVLREAHKQRDDVAKEGNGRDSIAICVLSQGGVLRQWVSAWDSAAAEVSPPRLMHNLADEFEDAIAGRFFYKVRETWGDLLSPDEGQDTVPALFSPEQMRRILVAELLAGEKPDAARLAEANVRVRQVLTLARRWRGDGQVLPERYDMDGPLIARFLGQERRGGTE